MSAFDIAGAVVWTPLAVFMWYVLFTSDGNLTVVGVFNGLAISTILSLAAAYCIARLFGASL
jgi:hypothetical protein